MYKKPRENSTILIFLNYKKLKNVDGICECSTKIFFVLKIQIGCHSDQLYDIKVEELKRPPNIVLVYPATEEKNKIASPYGGLIYIKVFV